jgi:hypothetical protein
MGIGKRANFAVWECGFCTIVAKRACVPKSGYLEIISFLRFLFFRCQKIGTIGTAKINQKQNLVPIFQANLVPIFD